LKTWINSFGIDGKLLIFWILGIRAWWWRSIRLWSWCETKISLFSSINQSPNDIWRTIPPKTLFFLRWFSSDIPPTEFSSDKKFVNLLCRVCVDSLNEADLSLISSERSCIVPSKCKTSQWSNWKFEENCTQGIRRLSRSRQETNYMQGITIISIAIDFSDL